MPRTRCLVFALLILLSGGIGVRPDLPSAEENPSLEHKIGQMLLVGFRGTSAPAGSPIIDMLKTINVGGVVLFDFDVPSSSFPRNIETPDQVRRLIRDLQSQVDAYDALGRGEAPSPPARRSFAAFVAWRARRESGGARAFWSERLAGFGAPTPLPLPRPARPPADLVVPPAPPLSASEELATFQLPPGFRAELVAAEPLVRDPVVAAFDARGRLWVAEMRGYMPDIDVTRVGRSTPSPQRATSIWCTPWLPMSPLP